MLALGSVVGSEVARKKVVRLSGIVSPDCTLVKDIPFFITGFKG
ncbi:hypothetical protein RsTz2092_06390 [Deferribacterales bacterium RsTz2092]